MDELELLKKDWQERESQMPKLSYDEIYGMLWKRSSSIVKWVFIISVIEFVLPHLLYLFPSTWEGIKLYEKLGLKNLMMAVSIFQYIVVFYFIYQFYRRYREISVLDNAKELMSRIIRTRQTVKNYIIFALSLFLLSFLLMAVGIYFSDPDVFIEALNLQDEVEEMPLGQLKSIFIIVLILLGLVFTAVLGLIYFLIYGLLMRKLGRNFKELKKLEI